MQGENLNLHFNNEIIYENANFLIQDMDKVGIVGVNGAGKTTLFKVILKEQELSTGKIKIPKGKRIGYLPQEIKVDGDITVWEYLMQARPIDLLNQELTSLYDQVASEQNINRQHKLLKKIGNIQDQLEYYDCYQAETILFEIITKMNIDEQLLDLRLMELSGGQKSKIAFAHLLYSKPEILLLDEPTNHLDQDTREYITDYLKHYQGMVLIISHDISFIDAIVNKIMYIDKVEKKITVYEGDYKTYQKKVKQQKDLKKRLIEKQEKEEQKLRDIVLLYSNSSGKRKRMAQSREKQLAKMTKQRITKDKEYKRVKLNICPAREGSKIPVKVNDITFSYREDSDLIHNLSFMIQNRERFLIVGHNGVGKSTLLKLLVGQLTPFNGKIWFGSKTDIAYYAQEQELLVSEKTILENVDTQGYSEKELRTVLGSFLFHGDDVFKKVAILSPGEKARVSLCKIMLQKANLLLLDEPTNHLDPETQALIAENFKNYQGTIIVVSHNPAFVDAIGIDRMLLLPSGKIVNYNVDTVQKYYLENTANQ
ncbi:MAG: ABC-F family ATP-binding cassette domain-containing protein [Bacilli bacterium]|nr:ABC-F family ATP-binding cassette domain-containing protein [Bacilli bacterium]